METTEHTRLQADGKARQFNFVMEAKSVITFPWRPAASDPTYDQRPGLVGPRADPPGRGPTDSGKARRDARLQNWPDARAHALQPDWRWDGREVAILQSRCN